MSVILSELATVLDVVIREALLQRVHVLWLAIVRRTHVAVETQH